MYIADFQNGILWVVKDEKANLMHWENSELGQHFAPFSTHNV